MDLSEIGLSSLQSGDTINYSAIRPASNREWVIHSVSSVENRKVRTGVVLGDKRARIHDDTLTLIHHANQDQGYETLIRVSTDRTEIDRRLPSLIDAMQANNCKADPFHFYFLP
ncbi:Putative LOC100877332 [Caligus rogercresseyi]|uniref:LOC100877332 n=1 Tax=Caligus rogercresseyi TaxID=217165 RepID=A0A7T8GXH9_CALRO|nr:Putative LOC100877332 [Caligus rogercresseyi]